MATKAVLAELASAYEAQMDSKVVIESVGGVRAAERIRAGEAFDVVVLARDAISKLLSDGHLVWGSEVQLVRSEVAVAVRAGAARPDIGSEAAVRAAVSRASRVGISTGPSGVELAALFERWGMNSGGRVVISPPGVPVGSLVASGEVELGFQQYSELFRTEGIDVLGTLPDPIRIVTTFSGAVAKKACLPNAATSLLEFMASNGAVNAKRRHGLQPA
jgi:molybdate transport system substrate-binding protein